MELVDPENVRRHLEAFGGPERAVSDLALSVIDVRPRSLEEFIAHVEYFYGGIRLSTKGVCPGHTAPGVVWWKHFNDEVIDSVIVGSRESGKTLGYALLDHMQMHFNGDEIANIGAVEAQAKKCYSYIQKFCNMIHWRRYLAKPSMISETIFKNGGKVEVMPATMNRVNSPHPRVANWDEIELTAQKVLDEGCLATYTMIACRYGEKKISDIVVGDEVWTCGEGGVFKLAPVQWVGATGRKRMVRFTLSNGRQIDATPNHRFLARGLGWTAAAELEHRHGLVSYMPNSHYQSEGAVLQASLPASGCAKEFLPDMQQAHPPANIENAVLSRAHTTEKPSWMDSSEKGATDLQELRYRGDRKLEALHGVPKQSGGFSSSSASRKTVSAATRALLFLWKKKNKNSKKLQRMLDENGRQARPYNACFKSAQGGYCTNEPARSAFWAGKMLLGVIANFGARLYSRICHTKMVNRLLRTDNQNGNRSIRSHSPHASSSDSGCLAHTSNRGARLQSSSLGRRAAPSMDVSANDVVWIVDSENIAAAEVWDISLGEFGNNFVASGVVVHNSSMPVRQNGRPPALRYTSSRKKAYGPLEELLQNAEDRGLTTFFFCVFEVIEQCPTERHQNGIDCASCPLAEDCLYDTVDERGELVKKPGPGRAAYANGWMNIDDVIRQKRVTAKEVWDSQWLCLRPMQTGLIYPMFGDQHILEESDYDWNPSLPVYAGMDFGYSNPGCILYAQMMPTDELIVFAEDYEAGRITPRWASAVKATPWYKNLKWVVGDPAAADGRNTMANAGVPMLAANNEVDNGLARVRYLMEPPGLDRPLLYISKRCKNLIRELKSYHVPDKQEKKNVKEEPEKIDDHAADSLRYVCSELYAGRIAI